MLWCLSMIHRWKVKMSSFEQRQSSSSRDIFSTIGAADASSILREQQNSCTYIPNFIHFCRAVGRKENPGGKENVFLPFLPKSERAIDPLTQVPTALFCRAIYLHSRFNFLTSFSLFFLCKCFYFENTLFMKLLKFFFNNKRFMRKSFQHL